MSLNVDFIDRPDADSKSLWTISMLGESVDIRLTWKRVLDAPNSKSEPEPESEHVPETEPPTGRLRYSLFFVSRAIDGELPTRVELRPLESDDEDLEAWTGHFSVKAPQFWPMTIQALVDGSPPMAIRLIPRLSVLASGLLLTASLLSFAVFGAYTLRTLELTTAETVTGASATAMIGAALAVGRAIERTSWPRALPFLGIPYLLPRAVTAVFAGFMCVFMGMHYGTVSLHNATRRNLELSLPARDKDVIEPGATLTYARRHEEVLERLENDHGEVFCAVDPWRESVPDNCTNPAKNQEFKRRDWQEYLAPPVLELRCKRRIWEGVTNGQLVELDGQPPAADKARTPYDALVLEPGEDCELPSPLLAKLRFPNTGGLGGHYLANYPWTPEDGAKRLTVLGVDAAPVGIHLEVRAERQHRPARADTPAPLPAPLGLVATQLEVTNTSLNGRGVLVPARRDTARLVVNIGGANAESGARKTLECKSEDPREDTHFRAVHIGTERDFEALLYLRAQSNQARWESIWQGPPTAANKAWMCPVVTGEHSQPHGDAARVFQTEKLTLAVNEDLLKQGLSLKIPAGWMASEIDVLSSDGQDPARDARLGHRIGTLECGLGDMDSGKITEVNISALRNVQWTPAGGVRSLEFTDALHSAWTSAEDHPSEWSWLCWTGNDGSGEFVADVTGHAEPTGVHHDAKLDILNGRFAVSTPKKKPCWRDSTRFAMAEPPAERACELASERALNSTNQTRGVKCGRLWVCMPEQGEGE